MSGIKIETLFKVGLCCLLAYVFALSHGYLEDGGLQSALHGVGRVLLGLVAIVLYLLPTVVAYKRGARGRLLICFINCWTGWTGIGWLVALFLANFSPSEKPQPVVIVERKAA